MSDETPPTDDQNEFTRESTEDRISLAAEFWDFLKHNKKWWLLPILIAIFAIGLLVVLGSTGAAPFIYPLF